MSDETKRLVDAVVDSVESVKYGRLRDELDAHLAKMQAVVDAATVIAHNHDPMRIDERCSTCRLAVALRTLGAP